MNVNNSREWENLRQDFINSKFYVCDTETNGVRTYIDSLACGVAFYFQNGSVYYVPVRHESASYDLRSQKFRTTRKIPLSPGEADLPTKQVNTSSVYIPEDELPNPEALGQDYNWIMVVDNPETKDLFKITGQIRIKKTVTITTEPRTSTTTKTKKSPGGVTIKEQKITNYLYEVTDTTYSIEYTPNNQDTSMISNLKDQFESPDKIYINHNLKFDIAILRHDGIEFPREVPMIDTMLIAHLLNENETNFKLKDLASAYVDKEASHQKDVVQEFLKYNGLSRYSQVPIHILGPYAENDVIITWKLCNYIMYGLYKDFGVVDALGITGINTETPFDETIRVVDNRVEAIIASPRWQELQNKEDEDSLGKVRFIKSAIENVGIVKNLISREMATMRIIEQAERVGLPVDTDRAHNYLKEAEHMVNVLYAEAQKYRKSPEDEINLASDAALSRYLKDWLMPVVQEHFNNEWLEIEKNNAEGDNQGGITLVKQERVDKETGETHKEDKVKKFKYAYPSVDEEHLAHWDHPLAKIITDYRGWRKMAGSYYRPILNGLDSDGRLHPSLHQIGTVTGRLSCKQPNMQALPRQSGDIYKVRDIIAARKDHVLMFADYAQAEMRVATCYTKEEVMADIIKSGEDLHSETAKSVFGKVDKQLRQLAKAINFGVIYGMGAKSFVENLKKSGVNLDMARAKTILDDYHKKFPGFQRVYSQAEMQAYRTPDHSIRMWTGRKRRFTPKDNYRKAFNSVIQGGVAEIVKDSMLEVDRILAGTKSSVVLQVHDEIIIDMHRDDWHLVPLVKAAMENFEDKILKSKVGYYVPFDSEVSWGWDWGHKNTWHPGDPDPWTITANKEEEARKKEMENTVQ